MLSRKPRLRDTDVSARARTRTHTPARRIQLGWWKKEAMAGINVRVAFYQIALVSVKQPPPRVLPAEKRISFPFFSLTTCWTDFEDPFKTFWGVVSWPTRAALLFLPPPLQDYSTTSAKQLSPVFRKMPAAPQCLDGSLNPIIPSQSRTVESGLCFIRTSAPTD